MKIIVVLCDPVKRAVSLYTHYNSQPVPTLAPFTDLVQIQDGHLVEKPHAWPQKFIECGLYAKFIREWLKYFPKQQMTFVSGEQLISNPVKEASKVLEFLGHPNELSEDNLYKDQKSNFYCFKSNGGSHWCLNRKTKGRKHPKVPQELIKALQNHYQPHNEELKQLIGRDFGWPVYIGQKN